MAIARYSPTVQVVTIAQADPDDLVARLVAPVERYERPLAAVMLADALLAVREWGQSVAARRRVSADRAARIAELLSLREDERQDGMVHGCDLELEQLDRRIDTLRAGLDGARP